MAADCTYRNLDCFAYHHGRCSILTDTNFTSRQSRMKCSFYKTEEQRKRDNEACANLFKQKGYNYGQV